MSNRLKKLQNEQDRLTRQIAIAEKTSNFAESVSNRRNQDNSDWRNHLDAVEAQRQYQNQMNNTKKATNESNIKQAKDTTHKSNYDQRHAAKVNTNDLESTMYKFRDKELNNKQQNAANSFAGRKEAQFKSKYDRDQYMESIQRANQAVKMDHAMKKSKHEQKLNQLNEMEGRMIDTLNKTLQKKQAAVDYLQSKSPALKNGIEPRKAYKCNVMKEDSMSLNQTMTSFKQ